LLNSGGEIMSGQPVYHKKIPPKETARLSQHINYVKPFFVPDISNGTLRKFLWSDQEGPKLIEIIGAKK